MRDEAVRLQVSWCQLLVVVRTLTGSERTCFEEVEESRFLNSSELSFSAWSRCLGFIPAPRLWLMERVPPSPLLDEAADLTGDEVNLDREKKTFELPS